MRQRRFFPLLVNPYFLIIISIPTITASRKSPSTLPRGICSTARTRSSSTTLILLKTVTCSYPPTSFVNSFAVSGTIDKITPTSSYLL
nr:hypothetical protein Iba_chr12cCG1630 [Ipomoea batatas]